MLSEPSVKPSPLRRRDERTFLLATRWERSHLRSDVLRLTRLFCPAIFSSVSRGHVPRLYRRACGKSGLWRPCQTPVVKATGATPDETEMPPCERAVSYTHLRAHETRHDLVCRLLLEKKKN